MLARTAFRHAIARALVDQASMVDGRVFIQRAAKLTKGTLPCVCVYTREERTKEKKNSTYLIQSLTITLEVYQKRVPDASEPGRNVSGLPSHPAQYAILAQDLDDICEEVEDVVITTLNPMKTVSEGNATFCVMSVQEVSTSITESDDGELPFAMATIQFVVEFSKDIKAPIEACDRKAMLAQVLHSTCDATDPLNAKVAIEVAL
jgi:hypothetical protein